MRVLLLNWRCIVNPQAGGAEVHIWKIFSHAVRENGWSVTALTSRFPGALERETVDGIEVVRQGGGFSYNFSLPMAYRSVAARFAPDVVVEFMNKVPLFGPLYVQRPLACFVHHLFGDAAPAELGRAMGSVIRAWEWPVPRVYRRTPMITGSQSSAQELVGLGLPAQNVAVVPYGTEVGHYAVGAKAERPTLLYAGRLKRYKGVHHLLQAVPELLKRFPDLVVNVAGDGDALPELRALSERLSLNGTVQFHGRTSEDEKRRLYQDAWALVFPSLKEGFGLTVAEAALCGTATVGFAVPGLCDAITHGETGLLVPYGDDSALAAALAGVLADRVLRDRLGAAAQRAYRDFTWERSAAEFLARLECVPAWDRRGWSSVDAEATATPRREQL
jgi:glycosyltransferase involved in cell wall biosynthesis